MQSSSMMNRTAVFIVVLLCGLGSQAAHSAQLREIRIGYLDRQEDPFYSDRKGYAGLYSIEHRSPLPGAELAIADSSPVGTAIGVKFVLIRRQLATGEDPIAALRALRTEQGAVAAILDLPLEDMVSVSLGTASESIVLFNVRHTDVGLREVTCRTNLFHTIPSLDMLTDGLAQGLRLRNWTRVLLLEGESPEDGVLSKAFQVSAKKFGLRIVEIRSFVLGNDPRQRDQNNIRLLTGGARHDVVFVADATREFAPFVPYNTMDPRPVVGSEGLVPLAWHIYWERHGAPQLNRRFARRNGHPMTDEDWATWAAVRSVAEALVKNRKSPKRLLADALLDSNLTLELYKGFPGSFRPWSRQLRQPILLGTTNAVVGLAPVEGALHKENNLDTLGADAGEFHCRS
jgi:ABC transporter substrate binding protein (PQQ-dependent alcohol dehydrogenase system)